VIVCRGDDAPTGNVPDAAATGPASAGTGDSAEVRVNVDVVAVNPVAAGAVTVMTHVPRDWTKK
jgi:hypothetical protein